MNKNTPSPNHTVTPPLSPSTFSLKNSFGDVVAVSLVNPHISNSIISELKELKPLETWNISKDTPKAMLLNVKKDNILLWEGIVPASHLEFTSSGIMYKGRLLPQKIPTKKSLVWVLWVIIAIVGVAAIGYLLFKGKLA